MSKRGGVTVVVGGQFGSEAKGHVAGRIARDHYADGVGHVGVRVAGPNAGHTAYDKAGHRFPFRQLPVAAVTNPDATLVIAAGSEVELPVLQHEVELAESRGHKIRNRLLIDRNATVLTESHKAAEMFGELQKRLGSTQKGVGAARADRLMRRASRVGDGAHREDFERLGVVTDTAGAIVGSGGAEVLIEGTQGYGLGLHTDYYPKCTSSDCRAIDFLAMAGLSPWAFEHVRVLVVCRVYPIRVAGASGPLRDETTWEALRLPEEHTTVTKKVRRVGLWDPDLARAAVAANGGPAENVQVVITMLDQMFPRVAGLDGHYDVNNMTHRTALEEAGAWIDDVQRDVEARVVAVGTGPDTMLVL